MTDFFVTNDAQLLKAHIALDKMEKPFKLKVSKGGKRSLEQNAYLWGVCYETILEHGLREDGFTKNDLHEYFLIEHFGHEVKEMFGKKRQRPLHRSSTLTKMEFVDFVACIQQFAAERGIYIPDPE